MGAMSTVPVSRATSAVRSMVGPGMGSAQSKYSRRVSTQKYMVLNSSGRQMICAPCPAASRTSRMAVRTFSSLSTWPMNCTPAILIIWVSSPASTKRRHHALGPVSHEAALVVEVHAHPELAGAGLDGPLQLAHAVGRRPHHGEALGEIVHQPQLVDQAPVPALGQRVIGER